MPPKREYEKVRQAIADVLEKDDYDDGAFCTEDLRLPAVRVIAGP